MNSIENADEHVSLHTKPASSKMGVHRVGTKVMPHDPCLSISMVFWDKSSLMYCAVERVLFIHGCHHSVYLFAVVKQLIIRLILFDQMFKHRIRIDRERVSSSTVAGLSRRAGAGAKEPRRRAVEELRAAPEQGKRRAVAVEDLLAQPDLAAAASNTYSRCASGLHRCASRRSRAGGSAGTGEQAAAGGWKIEDIVAVSLIRDSDGDVVQAGRL
ncbi:hypothetical protein EJB05_28298 [Eragrostis curvula]|uniref:Uncharacterized protein n=1 Tax=Eragrostis curvula TaxID=38414 RepID=A0A5J9UPL8_9POAL|nr:hypothetical protein EJB05_28298 [Eragrostis curvula]